MYMVYKSTHYTIESAFVRECLSWFLTPFSHYALNDDKIGHKTIITWHWDHIPNNNLRCLQSHNLYFNLLTSWCTYNMRILLRGKIVKIPCHMLLIQDDRKKITVSWYFTYYDLTFFSQYVTRYNYSIFDVIFR